MNRSTQGLTMRAQLSLLLLASLSTLALACGGGGECEQAFDQEIKCSEDPVAAKKEAESFRKAAIAACNADKSNPRMKTAIECGKKKSCDEFKACKLQARSADDIKEIEENLAGGKANEAMKTCSYSLETYKAVPAFKAACDKAFTAAFAKLDDKDARDDARYTCTSSTSGKEWLAASEPFKAGCVALKDQLQKLVTTQRDEGTEFDYSTCSSYQDMVKALDEAGAAAAELLCKEADQSDDYAKAIAAAQKNIDEKSASVPYECKSFLDAKEGFAGSEWFAGKASSLAKTCYGDLGKIVLAGVTSYCPLDAKDTHTYAAEFKLADADADLAALLAKTASKCN